MMSYEIAVIGNDEAAFEVLFLAAASGKRTVAILPELRHSAWLVGKAFRSLISDLLVDRTPARKRMFATSGTPRLLRTLVARAVAHETRTHVQVLQKLGVDVLLGEARFESQNDVTVAQAAVNRRDSMTSRHIVIGTGIRRTAMHRPLGLMPFHRPEALFAGRRLPGSVCIVGGSDFGIGLASLVALFGVDTRLVAREDTASVALELAHAAGVQIGNHPSEIGIRNLGEPFSNLRADVVDCRRSVGFTQHLNLEVVNVEPDENGQLWCAENFETWCSDIFGVGDVVGFSPDTALDPVIQAERVMNRIVHALPRPHLSRQFVAASK
ncbi:Soluble pyridine nucleotide transhydrogenase [Fuerstiella marisgermanici]|uniref:Soluble pyridine nucleotide transhydrogenase n=2 Tax=Fuerstiella marisgermanici TaxID=1891926 RepID=A0A1P8WA14_9PLAN|nr:Soluble pyridine nucleotide transhydrogenase [Fuerstiella marisgermanici]